MSNAETKREREIQILKERLEDLLKHADFFSFEWAWCMNADLKEQDKRIRPRAVAMRERGAA